MTTYTASAAQTLYTSNPHAVFSISDTDANLRNAAYASAVGAATSITVTGTITQADLALIVALNANTFLSAATAATYVSGAHGAFSVSDTAANLLLAANAAAVTAAASVIVTTPVTASQLSTATVGNVAHLNSHVIYTSISDTIANLLLLTGGLSSTFITHGSNVNVTGPAATVAQLVLLHNATATGTVTSAAISDTAANLITGIAYITSGTAVTVTTTATVAQLKAIDVASESLSGSSIVHHLTYTAITDSAVDLIPSGVVSTYVTNGINVTVTGSSTIAQLTAIHALNGTGTVTATAITDTVEKLLPSGVASTYLTGGVNVTVTDAATLAQLAALKTKTVTGTVTAHIVSDSVADLFTSGATFSAGATSYILHGTNVNVTGTGANAPTIAQLTAIKTANGIGSLTYAGITDTAANLAPQLGAPSIFITSGTAVTVTTAATLSQLAAIKADTAALSYTAVSDTAAKLAADAATHSGAGTYVTTGKAVTVTTAATLAQLAAIKAADATGTLTYTALSDTAANLATAAGVLTAAGTAYVLHGDNVNVTTAATVAQLTAINTATGGRATYTALTDTAANLAPAGVASPYIVHGTSVTVTTAASLAQLAAINTATGGAATYTTLADTAVNLAADAATNSGHGTYAITGKAVTVTNAATLAQLAAISAATGVAPTYTALADTASNLATDAATHGGAGTFVTTGKLVTVTTAASLAQLAAIDTATVSGTGSSAVHHLT
ncbi:MAG: beta strand repeat-containing protein, partial [Burkholderiales bacterium]